MGQKTFKPGFKSKDFGRKHNGRANIDAMYDKDWERYRKRFLAVNSECYACGSLAIVVDHLMPHQGDEKLFKKLDNHIPLCIVCHNTATSLFDKKYVRGNPIDKKIAWLNSNRFPTDNWIPKKVRVLSSYTG